MKRIALCVLTACFTVTLGAQPFSEFPGRVGQMPVSVRQAAADSFFKAYPVFPYIEHDTVCNFIYKGEARQVSVAGDMTGWQPGKIIMKRIDGTDLWFATQVFPPDARLDYKLVVDTSWIMDPANIYSSRTGFGVNSELRMPRYKRAPESIYDPAVPQGTIIDTVIYSSILKNVRNVRIYLPYGHSKTAKPYPVVLFHDGIEFITLADANVILDNMVASHRIMPVVAVFVEPVDRDPEYSGSSKDGYVAFVINELMPVIDTRYNTSSTPYNRATFGISNGGNAALYLGCRRPESFGKIAAFSSNIIPEIMETFSVSPRLSLDLYVDIGTYDIDVLIPMAEQFVTILNEKGYNYAFYRWNDGHSWANWRDHLGVALEQFFPYQNNKQ